MAKLINPNPVMPIGGAGLGGKTTHANTVQIAIPAGAIAAGDTYTVAHLPHSSRPIRMVLKNTSTVSFTFSLGTAANATEFRANGALAANAVATDLQTAAVLTRYTGYPTTPIVATFNTAVTVPVGSTMLVHFEYLVDEPVAI